MPHGWAELLLGGRSALAQEVCYAYDGLGRLIAAMDPQGQAAIYEYEAVGNTLAIDREGANGPVDIILMDPPGGTSGTQVTLFGFGFSPRSAVWRSCHTVKYLRRYSVACEERPPREYKE